MPVAIVTGASRGLGRALALELAAQGYNVGLVARSESALNDVHNQLQTAGHRSICVVADVTEVDTLAAATSQIESALGEVDLVVACAGIGIPDCLDPFDAPAVGKVFAVNLLGVTNTIAATLPGMLRRGRGHIVGISSLGADRGFPGSTAYCASKSALNTYLEGLRVALKPRGIAVTRVSPGFLRTKMTAKNDFHMPFLMEPTEAARRIVRKLPKRPAVYRFPLGMSLLMRVVSMLPEGMFARIVPQGRLWHDQGRPSDKA